MARFAAGPEGVGQCAADLSDDASYGYEEEAAPFQDLLGFRPPAVAPMPPRLPGAAGGCAFQPPSGMKPPAGGCAFLPPVAFQPPSGMKPAAGGCAFQPPGGMKPPAGGTAKKLSQKALAALALRRPASGPSTKELRADLARLRQHLGRACPHFGKRGVLQLAAPAGEGGSIADAPPRFNKYAGWAEWQNAVILWVNVCGGSFSNSFTHGGSQVNWYVGGARPTENSPIVQRLLGLDRTKRPPHVLMFARPTATEPYVNCGVVKYVAHDARKQGFEFTWRLRDFGALSKRPDFRRIMDAQSPGRAASRAAVKWA
ncbi:unnamed protein product [Prorocentrum cordatum]|uniref:Uncharacterized protein n=1 Tax=Prorocentrum cordatum TaxID=2364126 RepID=A0ABN9TAD9_9DINO|nr:unnamed protein product [Polarella glacialis]